MNTDLEALPESVRTRIDDMLARVPLMTPAELREYVTLLCIASFSEGAMAMAQEVKGAIAP
jgi:hypothetical protein